MLLKQRRFVNSKLRGIVELYEKDQDGKLTIEEANMLKIIKTKAKLSIGKTAERYSKHMDKKYDKAYKKYEDKFTELGEMLDADEISQEQYDKKIENAEYKLEKAEYVLDREGADEKPKNPIIPRAVENVKKAVKAVGKGIATTAGIVAGAVAFPFVMGYKGLKAVGNKVLSIGRGGKVAALTAGKVVSNTAKSVKENIKNQVGPIAQEVKETENAKRDMKAAEKSKELDDAATLSAKYDRFYSTSKQTQSTIRVKDWNAALKEDAKREREAARRENLHMDREEQHIDHEKANQGAEQTNEQEVERASGTVVDANTLEEI